MYRELNEQPLSGQAAAAWYNTQPHNVTITPDMRKTEDTYNGYIVVEDPKTGHRYYTGQRQLPEETPQAITEELKRAQMRYNLDHPLETMQRNNDAMEEKYGTDWRNSSPYGMSVGNGEDTYKLLALTGLPAAAIVGGIGAYKDTQDYNRGYRTKTSWNPELQHTEEVHVPISTGNYATNLALDALPAATFGAGRLLSSAGRGLAAASEGATATGLRAGSQAARWANAPMLSRSVQLPLRAMTTTGEVMNPAVNVVIPRWAGIAGAAAAGAATYPALRQASQQVSPLLMSLGYTSLHNGLEGLLPQTRSRTRDLMPRLDSTLTPVAAGTVSNPTDSTGLGTAAAGGSPADSTGQSQTPPLTQGAAGATANQTDTTANQARTTPPNNNNPNDKKEIFFKRWNASFKKNYPKLHKYAKNTTKYVILPGALLGGGIAIGSSLTNKQLSDQQNAKEQKKNQAEKDSVMKDVDTIRVKDYSTDSTSQDQGNMQMVPLDTSKIVDRGDLINYNE